MSPQFRQAQLSVSAYSTVAPAYLCFHALFFYEDVEGTLVDDVKVVTRIPWTINKEVAPNGQGTRGSASQRNRAHSVGIHSINILQIAPSHHQDQKITDWASDYSEYWGSFPIQQYQQISRHTFPNDNVVWFVLDKEHGIFHLVCLLRIQVLEHSVDKKNYGNIAARPVVQWFYTSYCVDLSTGQRTAEKPSVHLKHQ